MSGLTQFDKYKNLVTLAFVEAEQERELAKQQRLLAAANESYVKAEDALMKTQNEREKLLAHIGMISPAEMAEFLLAMRSSL